MDLSPSQNHLRKHKRQVLMENSRRVTGNFIKIAVPTIKLLHDERHSHTIQSRSLKMFG